MVNADYQMRRGKKPKSSGSPAPSLPTATDSRFPGQGSSPEDMITTHHHSSFLATISRPPNGVGVQKWGVWGCRQLRSPLSFESQTLMSKLSAGRGAILQPKMNKIMPASNSEHHSNRFTDRDIWWYTWLLSGTQVNGLGLRRFDLSHKVTPLHISIQGVFFLTGTPP